MNSTQLSCWETTARQSVKRAPQKKREKKADRKKRRKEKGKGFWSLELDIYTLDIKDISALK